jgi:hypothetical protein
MSPWIEWASFKKNLIYNVCLICYAIAPLQNLKSVRSNVSISTVLEVDKVVKCFQVQRFHSKVDLFLSKI